jgi:hypothetical protein
MQMINSAHIKAHRSAAAEKGRAKAGDWPLAATLVWWIQ